MLLFSPADQMETSWYRVVVMTFFAYLTFVIASLVCKCFSELSLCFFITSSLLCVLMFSLRHYFFSVPVFESPKDDSNKIYSATFSPVDTMIIAAHCQTGVKLLDIVQPSNLVQVHIRKEFISFTFSFSFSNASSKFIFLFLLIEMCTLSPISRRL